MAESTVESVTEVSLEQIEKRPMRVLHVDDEPNFLKVAKQILEMQGDFQVETAASVEEAQEKTKKKKFDVIVADYVMPRKDGLEFLKELRDSGDNVPFVMFTGKSREEVAIEALNLGADWYFNKIGDPKTVYGELAHGIRKSVQARRALEVEKLYGILVENLQDAIVFNDMNGRSIFVNKAAEELTGYKREEMLGHSVREIISRKYWSLCDEMNRKAAMGKSVPYVEMEIRRKDGKTIPVETGGQIIRENGKITGTLIIARDITERKKAEEKIKKTSEEWQKTFDAISDFVFIINKDFRLVKINKAFSDFLKRKPEELIGKHCFEVLHGTDKPWVNCPFLETLKTKKPITKEILDSNIGIPLLITNSPILDENGELIGCVHIAKDIRERKRVEEELRKSEKRFRSLIQNSSDIIVVLEPDMTVRYASPSVKHVLGYEPKDLVGKKALGYIHPEDLPAMEAKIGKTIQNPGVAVPSNFRVRHANGSWRYIESIASNAIQDAEIKGLILNARDITERKKVEEVLLESEAKYRQFFEDSSDGLVIIDKENGDILDCNREFVHQTGRDKEELLKMKIWDIRPPELRETAENKFFEVKRQGQGGSMELDFQKPSGKRIRIDFLSKATMIEGKEVLQSRCRNITKRTMMEEALKESEGKYRSMIELAPDGIITVNTKGVITSANNAFLRLTGYSQDEIVGIHFTKLGTLRARDIPKYLKLMSSVIRGKIPEPFEYSYVRKDGTIGWGEAHVGLLKRDGKTTGFLVLLREITGRKMAERATRESEEKFERLFLDNPEVAIYTDSKFHLLDVNPRFKELFGYSLDEIKGKHVDNVVVPKDKIREAEMLNKKAKKGYVYHDTVRKKKDGSLVPVSISAAPITVEDRLVGYVAVYKDISQLKETLEKLETMNEKLRVVGNLTRHDARNKLSTVTMNTFLAKQKLTEKHEALQHLSEVESAVGQVEGIFDFARIYEKLGMEELTYMYVEKNLEESASLFSDLKNIKVVNDCRGLTVLADSLLRQLFYNLIDNSLKHGKKVSQIRAYYEAGKDQLKLVYEDDGVGIPKAEKDKIFEEGYGKGTGHGLYLIRKMCEVYGWNIQETGRQGKGAQFTITIPKMNEKGKMNYILSN